ncbi:MAG: hypothetical protein ABIF71_06825 [Planctomycetota bacterium]
MVQKRLPARVASPDLLQYILDYVDPSKKKAQLHPQKIADLLGRNIARSHAALALSARK